MRHAAYLTILIIALVGCKPTDEVKFEEAQPESVKPISDFSRNIRGIYTCIENPDKELIIGSDMIQSLNTFSFAFERSEIEIDSTEGIDIYNDHELSNYLDLDGGKTIIKGDSIFYNLTMRDTLFIPGDKQVLKKLSGNYFLNYKHDDNLWTVKKVEIHKDTLIIGEITPSDTLLRFDFVAKRETLIEKDSSTVKEYILTPDKRDLKKMIKSEAFNRTEKYVRK